MSLSALVPGGAFGSGKGGSLRFLKRKPTKYNVNFTNRVFEFHRNNKQNSEIKIKILVTSKICPWRKAVNTYIVIIM